ncbi:MAG: SDR family oxidoreductase [Clostridiales bacterium]|nr:SDR family oxidoreductase [Clostridiales bacterium]
MKTVLITGATGAIGAACAREFAKQGYSLALHYHENDAAARALFFEFAEQDVICGIFRADLRSPPAVRGMFSEIHERLGKLSVLVNNAGYAPVQGLFSRFTEEEYNKTFDLNVRGAMECARFAAEDMHSLGGGAIVNVSSVWGVHGASCEALYSASKAAIIGFTKALAKELAPCGIRVNCLAPGMVESKMNAHLSQTELEEIRAQIPLGRLGTAADMAGAVLFLAENAYVTGQVLVADGGWIG